MKNSGIWWDVSWNPMTGCTHVSEACDHCYAERMAKRFNRPDCESCLREQQSMNPMHEASKDECKDSWCGFDPFEPTFHRDRLQIPLHWRRPRRIFVNSMSDTFHEAFTDEQIDSVFAVMAACPQHFFLVLTKRPEEMRDYITKAMERVAALRYDVTYERRGDSSRAAGTGDRLGGSNLAHRDAARQGREEWRRVPQGLDDEPLREAQDRIGERTGIPTGSRDGGRPANVPNGASRPVGPSSWSDSRGVDDQSQERKQGGQPSRELGTGDLLRAETSCTRRAPCGEEPSDRQQTPKDASDGERCTQDSSATVRGSHGQGHRGGLRDETQGCVGDLLPEDLAAHLTWPLPNLWLGVTVENQAHIDRWDILAETPAAARFVCHEPLLGPIEYVGHPMPEWLIVGGENGPGARPMKPEWALGLYQQCKAAGVPFWWKGPGSKGVGPYSKDDTDNAIDMMCCHKLPSVQS